MKGADWAWAQIAPSVLKTAGITFAVRYVSHDLSKLTLPSVSAADEATATERSRRSFTTTAGPPRKTTHSEVAGLLAAGIAVAMVWEDTANAAAQGHARGVSDATEADRQVKNLGLPGIPIYMAVDYDAATGDQTAINAYLDGAASVIGHNRVGVYGGYWVVSRARAAGKATYYWGTYAWSGTNWGSCGWSPHLMQQLAMVYIGGHQCDIDLAYNADFGQWPRPGSTTDPTITAGDSGPAVTKAQQRLNVWGAKLTVDGTFGSATTAAVTVFQGTHSLATDGVVGPDTWVELEKTPPPPGQLPAPTGLAVDRSRLTLGWQPVPGTTVTGYTVVAYSLDGKECARLTTAQPWCVLNGLTPGWTYNVRVWANGGQVAPDGATITVTLPS